MRHLAPLPLMLLLQSVTAHIAFASDSCERVFSIQGRVYCSDSSLKGLRSFDVGEAGLRAGSLFPVEGVIQQVSPTNRGLLIATGQGRGDLNAPIRIFALSPGGAVPKKIFEKATERSQVTFLSESEGKIWMTFFESKYQTLTGYFETLSEHKWSFRQELSQRMGDVTEVLGPNTLLVGRPYGDAPGEDGDLRLHESGRKIDLPSYRGVRAAARAVRSGVAFVSDGWHQNYGGVAQARLNLLIYNERAKAYSLQFLVRDYSQYTFSKIIPIVADGEELALVVGNKKVSLIGPAPSWKQRDVYEAKFVDKILDAAFVEVKKDVVRIVVLDGAMQMISVPTPFREGS